MSGSIYGNRMNPAPFVYRFVSGWKGIEASVNRQAIARGLPTYGKAKYRYRFEGWGVAGFPPKLHCNVKYFGDGAIVDMGRHPK